MTLEDRFWAKVNKAAPGECWPWTASRVRTGYGRLRVGSVRDGTRRTALAHRVSWELANGHVPFGLCVLHRCDFRACVNPAHLFLGNHQENTADMIAKGRRCDQRGERHPAAKLTADDVIDIRTIYAFGATQTDIAYTYGVTCQSIWDIVHRINWRHV